MSYDDFVYYLRLVDAFFAAAVFGVMMFRGRQYWSRYYLGEKLMYSAFTLYVGAVAYTSYELYAQEVAVGLRSYLILAANFVAAYALMKYRGPKDHANGA